MASSQEQNGCRLRILLVKCLKILPAGIGHWNVLRNRTFYRNVGCLKHKSRLPSASGGCAQLRDSACETPAGQRTPPWSCRHTASALRTARRGAAVPFGSKHLLALRRALKRQGTENRWNARSPPEALLPPPSKAAGAPSLPRGLTQRSRGKEGSKRQPGQELLNAASSALNPVLPPPAAAVEGMTQRQRAQRTENNPSRSLSESPWPVTFSPAEGRGGRSDLPVSGMFGSQR